MKKRIITLVTLVFLLVGMTSNIFAAGDYGNDPVNPTPTPPVVTPKPTAKPAATPKATTAPENKKEEAVKEAQDTIKNAETATLPTGVEGKVVEVAAGAKLPSTLIAEAVKSTTPVSFMNKEKTVAIQFADLTVSADQLRDLSAVMNVATDTAAKEKVLATVNEATKEIIAASSEKAVFIQPEAQGEFGVTMNVSVQAAEKPAEAKYENPFLYYLADDGKVENQGFAVVKDGWTTFAINHASSYMISYDLIDGAVVNTESANYKANKASGVDVDAVLNPSTEKATVAPTTDNTTEPAAPATNNNSTMLFVGGIALVAVIVVIVVISKRKKDTVDPTNKPKA